MIEVKKRMDTAQRELFRAKEKCRSDNTERQKRENATRRDEQYLVGEKVLLYNRLVGDDQDPPKLKFRASLCEVKEVNGDIGVSQPTTAPKKTFNQVRNDEWDSVACIVKLCG